MQHIVVLKLLCQTLCIEVMYQTSHPQSHNSTLVMNQYKETQKIMMVNKVILEMIIFHQQTLQKAAFNSKSKDRNSDPTSFYNHTPQTLFHQDLNQLQSSISATGLIILHESIISLHLKAGQDFKVQQEKSTDKKINKALHVEVFELRA